jgi:hypothetical protein
MSSERLEILRRFAADHVSRNPAPMNPVEHLKKLKMYPDLSKLVDSFRAGRGKDLPRWPDWCFLPMAAWYAIICHSHRVSRVTPEMAEQISHLAALGTWRYSQGIYRFDQDLLCALAECPVSGELPSDVLIRLPEWCLYVETPGFQYLNSALHGFWVHLEWDANTERSELRFLLHHDAYTMASTIHIGPWTIEEAIDRAMRESERMADQFGLPRASVEEHAKLTELLRSSIAPLVSIVLYLCSDAPEVDDGRVPNSSIRRPVPVKTKTGLRFFPAEKAKVFQVGQKVGELLRQGQVALAQSESDGTRSVRPHLRRGHWHGYWVGPRDGDRRFSYRWIAPMVVGA